ARLLRPAEPAAPEPDPEPSDRVVDEETPGPPPSETKPPVSAPTPKPAPPPAPDLKLVHDADDLQKRAKTLIDGAAAKPGDAKYDDLREALKLLETARDGLNRFAEEHPERSYIIERRMMSINSDIYFCRKVLPPPGMKRR